MALFVFIYFAIIFKYLTRLFPPTTNDHNCSGQTQYFGVLYRQLLPQFVNEIPDTPKATQNEIMKMMKLLSINWFEIMVLE